MVSPPALRPMRTGTRVVFKVLGPVLLIGGLAMAAFGFVSFGSATPSINGPPPSFYMFGLGGFCMVIGMALTGIGYRRRIAETTVTDLGPSMEYASHAQGRGFGSGLRESGLSFGSGAGTVQIVRIKCRACGYLESEDARFCSKCSKAM